MPSSWSIIYTSRIHNILGTSISLWEVGGLSLLEMEVTFLWLLSFPALSLDSAVDSHTGTWSPCSEVNEGVLDGNNIHFAEWTAALVTSPSRPHPFILAFTVMSQGTAITRGWEGARTTVSFLTQALPAFLP